MAGGNSQNLATAASFQGYVREYAPELISKIFFGFKTAMIPGISIMEGVKGQMILTELVVADLVKKWDKDFVSTANALNFKPRTLTVIPAKVDLSFTPQEFETTYLGQFRKQGQNPGADMPFEGYILEKLLGKIQQELEVAVWRAAVPGSPTSTDPLALLFDGFLELTKDLVTAGHGTVAVSGGAYTVNNIIANFEDMFDTLSPALQDMPVVACMSMANLKLYRQAYRELYGKHVVSDPADINRVKLDFGDVTLIGLPGFGVSDRVIMTPAANLHIGFDQFSDTQTFNFEQEKRAIDMWMDFKMGVQVAITDDDFFVVNDLA
jgi:hypothetical protein